MGDCVRIEGLSEVMGFEFGIENIERLRLFN